MFGKTDNVHLIGIGGYGMSGLAKLLLEMGYSVSGSDLKPSDITKHLTEMGAEISIGHQVANVKNRDVIVYSTAIPEENDELQAGRKTGRTLHRSELLAMFLNSKKGIAITGAHGKTTTTTMLALIMEAGGLDPTALIGGEVQDFSGTARLGGSEYVVAEADESDQSFTRYRPWYSVITNIEADHLENYNGSFESLLEGYGQYLANIDPQGLVLLPVGDDWIDSIAHHARCRQLRFGIEEGDYQAQRIEFRSLGSRFQLLHHDQSLGEIELNVPGRYNILNAVAAAAISWELGVEFSTIQHALLKFRGAKRRFEVLAQQPFMVVDDYAHHPTEVKACLAAAANMQPTRVVAIFQPHRYTRTQYFMDEFASSFSQADIVIIDDIYDAGEKPLPGVSAAHLAEKIAMQHSGQVLQLSGQQIVDWIKEHWQQGDVTLTMGAGDINKIGQQLGHFSCKLLQVISSLR